MSITLEDIAQKAACSITTISRPLNDCNDVSEEINQLIKSSPKRRTTTLMLLPNVCE